MCPGCSVVGRLGVRSVVEATAGLKSRTAMWASRFSSELSLVVIVISIETVGASSAVAAVDSTLSIRAVARRVPSVACTVKGCPIPTATGPVGGDVDIEDEADPGSADDGDEVDVTDDGDDDVPGGDEESEGDEVLAVADEADVEPSTDSGVLDLVDESGDAETSGGADSSGSSGSSSAVRASRTTSSNDLDWLLAGM